MKTLWSSIWTFLLVICGLIWYAIDGWMGIMKAVLAMIGLGMCIAGLLKMRQARREKAALPGPWLRDRMSGVLTTSEKRALLAWAEKHPYGECLPEEQESEEEA